MGTFTTLDHGTPGQSYSISSYINYGQMFPIFLGEKSPTSTLSRNCSMGVKKGGCDLTEALMEQAVSFPKYPNSLLSNTFNTHKQLTQLRGATFRK